MLSLLYQGQTQVPVEVEGITPDVVRALSLAEIERLPVYHGNRPATLGDFFQVRGDASDEHIEWLGDLRGVHWLGAKMKSGRMDVRGSAGRHVGSELSGGEIHVEGDVSDWAGGEMHGGLLHIRGNAGHLVGAAYRGSPRGMTKGTILVHGNAGNEIGHTMRRGLIAIGGESGDLAGFNMRAGTVLLGGSTGIRHGAGMRRGTIGFLEARPPMLPSFHRACRYRPEFLGLLLRQIAQLGFPVRDEWRSASFELYSGDLIEGGRGEILLPA
ncbi:MAG: formylmethanofuran dehydrogenase subunit C [Pirellulales bacterium]